MNSPQISSSSSITHPDPNLSHSYGTRTRKNILLKPSTRLCPSPDPPPSQHRRVKPTPKIAQLNTHPGFPLFPPPGIVLHPDDANSKVFMAIGRSFLSVDNRAMTIKDLAEMTVKFGLVCQNVSAASQAITTYIRTHMQRCDMQQDQPLLLRHVLSGTTADDDLLPALHSRSGGAHCPVSPDNRVTNFRRGTMVWYLSRSTGVPCPFARAGIRLCDYGEDGKVGNLSLSKEKKRQRDRERRTEQCGQKRKRPLRGCVAKGFESDSQDDERRPPKVKLTLRLKPLNHSSPSPDHFDYESRRIIDLSKEADSDSEDFLSDTMSVDSSDGSQALGREHPFDDTPWSLPPYPKRSISIPRYTPSSDGPYPSFSSPSTRDKQYRFSSCTPYSISTPPPDSEDEDDDFHITMTGARRHSVVPRAKDPDDEWDADLDSDGDGETIWESPGPRSPSAPLTPEIAVKEEGTDLQGLLNAWEDFDCGIAGAKVVEVIAQAAACALDSGSKSKVKAEVPDTWNWVPKSTERAQDWRLPSEENLTTRIKQEDVDSDLPFSLQSELFPELRSSPLSPTSPLPGLSYSPSPSPESPRDEGDWTDNGRQFTTVRAMAAPSSVPPLLDPSSSFALPVMMQHNNSGPLKLLPDLVLSVTPSISHSLAALIQSMSMNSPTSVSPSSLSMHPPCISPLETHCKGASFPDTVVVQTCQPCTPPISATQIEGISVYRMMLGSHLLLRRIDTDFVNLMPIVAYSGAPYPVISTIPNAVTIAKGSPAVSGTWVPLSAAQAYIRDHPALQGGPFDVFLSDVLFERFPTALQDFHKSSTAGRTLNQFGPHFGSTLQATQLHWQSDAQSNPYEELTGQHDRTSVNNLLSRSTTHPPPSEQGLDEVDRPLNAAEQEIFREICDISDSDKENASPSSSTTTRIDEKGTNSIPEVSPPAGTSLEQASTGACERSDRPLRRSKRVADAIAAQSRTRSRRGGSRNSLL